jgi:hypothetical protein
VTARKTLGEPTLHVRLGKRSDAFLANQHETAIAISLIREITGNIGEDEPLYTFGSISAQPLTNHAPH